MTVLSARLPTSLDFDAIPTRANTVGGVIIIFSPDEYTTLRSIQGDPGKLGVLTTINIGVGPSHSLVWLIAYVPCVSSGKTPGSLGNIVMEFLSPQGVNHSDSASKAQNWVWSLIEDRVARSVDNPMHLGVTSQEILTRNGSLSPLSLIPMHWPAVLRI